MVHSHNFYQLYQSAYTKYRDLYGSQVCVFLQKGSFFEIYGQEDPQTKKQINTGKQILELLSLQTHVYEDDGPNGTTGYYGGVPVISLDKWAGKLTQEGWTVVILEEAKTAAGKVSERQVTKVLSAGTHLESAESSKSHFLATVFLETQTTEPPLFGVAAADLTTGQIVLYEGAATGKADCWHTDDLRHFFQIYAPKELVLYTKGLPLSIDTETLRRTFYVPKAPIHRKVEEPASGLEKPLVREEYLRALFQPKTALPLRTWLRCSADGTSRQERALTHLLRFAEDHAPGLAKCLQAPSLWHPAQSLQIINNALTQLNLIGTQEQGVQDLFHAPITAMGKRSLTARLCTPVADTTLLLQRQTELEWIQSNPSVPLELGLRSLFDLSRLHRSVLRATVKAADLVQLHQSYEGALLLLSALEGTPFLASNPQFKIQTQQCIQSLYSQFDLAKAVKAQAREGERGFLLDTIGPKTARAEATIEKIYERANQWLQGLITLTGASPDSLYYKPTEKNMFCIHTTKTVLKLVESKVKADPTYTGIHTKVLSSAGRIEHAALDDFQSQLDSAKAVLERCLAAELPPACIQFAEETRHLWQPLENWIINLDLALAFAKTAKEQGWVKPVLENTEGPSRVQIQNLRHPLIEARNTQSRYVTHNISLGYGDQQGWLLYGMNASGKSSLMKAIGLAVLLAQVGSYVPATEMTLRPFQKLATRILNQDNLWAGLSSFAVEMSELREVLAVADDKTLVLGDELCAGTESISGTAIVAAGIQHLHKAGSRFVLATHLHDLMRLPAVTTLPALQVYHLHVEYDPVKDALIYHRSLRKGSGSSIYGLEVAKALHLPYEMIEAAFAMRRTLIGEAAVEEGIPTNWNRQITRRSCSVCHNTLERDLEVHHLQERADATPSNRNADGTALHHVRNLAVLCQRCHDKHHAGTLVVGPVVDTSHGPERQVIDLSQYAHTESAKPAKSSKTVRSKFTAEQIQEIKAIVAKKPGLSPKLWAFQIFQETGIEITESQFKTLQKKGEL